MTWISVTLIFVTRIFVTRICMTRMSVTRISVTRVHWKDLPVARARGHTFYSGALVSAGFGLEPAPGGGRRTNRSVRIPGNLGPDPAAIRHGVGTSAGPAAQRTWRRSQAATAEALRRSALATATGRHGGGLAQASRTSTVICRAKVAAERRRRRRNEARETQAPAHAGTRIPPTA